MGVELEASINLGVAIGDKLDKLHTALTKPDPKPLYFQVGAGRVGGGGLPLGRPPAGKMWNLLSMTITGNDDHTTLANVLVALYIGGDPFNLNLMQCVVPAQAVPSFQTFSKGTIWVHTETLVANISGSGTGNNNIQVNLNVAEWKVTDISSSTA